MTILVLGVVLLVLGVCGIWYSKYVETQTLLIQERNFRALTVTSHALREMVTNYESVFRSVIEGEPPCNMNPCPEENRRKAYEVALLALQAFREVKVTKEAYENEGFAVKFVYQNGSSIKLTYLHQDRAKPIPTKWKVTAVMDIGPIMRQLVTEDIFSDVLLANPTGRVLYHHQSMRDPSGFKFEDVSALLHRLNGSESKESGGEKNGVGRNEDLVSTLPLFNEAPIGGISHAIFAQATDLPAAQGTAQTVILVGIVPAGQFHAESRAIAFNVLLVMVGLTLVLFFVLPYVKLRTNVPTERLTPISVAVLIFSSILGVAVLTFGLADIATYHNLEQHLDRQLEVVSEEIRTRFNADVRRGLDQLEKFDESCQNKKCSNRPGGDPPRHCAQRLSIANMGGTDKEFSFNPISLNNCSGGSSATTAAQVFYRDVISMLWIEMESGELTVLQSREPDPWKYVNLKERQYVRRILDDEPFRSTVNKEEAKFWIQPIYSWTTGDNSVVLSKESTARQSHDNSVVLPNTRNPHGRIVAALEVTLPSVTNVGVPPGMGFAVIDHEGEVLFHSDERRNLRENFFEETDRDGRLRQAVFARAKTPFEGRYWGKDRHFHITPLFSQQSIEPGIGQKPESITESPDVHWSLVTYWDIDMLRDLNFRALYSSSALFLIYGIIALSIAIPGWWISSRASEAAYRWVWPQSEHRHHYQIAMGLLVASLVAVGIWYLRPHPAPEMLLWGLLPALAAAAIALSIAHTKADPSDHSSADAPARPSYRLSYALVVTLIFLTFVVIPALVIFRVAINVEWGLFAKFSLYDLEQKRDRQAQKVRLFHPSALFDDPQDKGEIRSRFLDKFSEQNVVYADFPFELCRQGSQNCREVSTSGVQRGDERLIQWLYDIIERPHIGRSRAESDAFLKVPMVLKLSEPLFGSRLGTLSLGNRSHEVPLPIPEWLYSLLILGGFLPLAVLWVKKVYAFAAVMCVLAGFLSFGLVGQALAVLWVSALLYGTYYVLPRFAARRVLLLNYPYPSNDSSTPEKAQEIAGMAEAAKPPDGWSPGLWDVCVKEMSGLSHALHVANLPCSVELTESCERILNLDPKDDFDVVKERIIREFQKNAADQYLEMWKQRTASEQRSLFNLARDGFLHARNPDIDALLKSGLIVADLNLRPMNESFGRFIIRTGVKERLDEDIAKARTGAWWRPIGVGLVLVMVFLVLTQDQYRAITLAFLGVLPGLLGAFSQAWAAPKKEKEA